MDEQLRKALWKATFHKYIEMEFDSGINPNATMEDTNKDIAIVWTRLVAEPESMIAKMIEYTIFFRN